MRTTFFALSGLPFYAFAQDPVPDAAVAASEAFVPPVIDTSIDVPLDLHPTSSDAIVVPESTTEVDPEITTAQVPTFQDTSTGLPIVVDSSTLPVPVDTTTGPASVVDISTDSTPAIDTAEPIAQDTTTQPLFQGTATGQPSVIDASTGSAPVIGASTGSAPDIDASTGSAPDIDASTGSAPVINTGTQPTDQDPTTQPIVQSTTVGQPVVADTTLEQQPPVGSTTTGVPSVETTAEISSAEISSAEISSAEISSAEISSAEISSAEISSAEISSAETTVEISSAETTAEISSAETSTGPPAETTIQQESVQDTTTTAAGQPVKTTSPEEVKTTEESKPSTKDEEPAITQAPTTTAAAAATASVSSVSSEVAVLIPIINKWAEDPDSLTDETNKKVEDTHGDIIAVVVGLGGKPDVACNKKRGLGMRRLKGRGLLGPIGDVINKLACMAQDLTKISSNIIAGNVPAVTSVIPQVKSQNDDLTEEEENKSNESKDSTKQETTKQATTESPTSTEESTTTEATTTATSDMIVCASGSCGGGSCPIGLGSSGSMPERMKSIPRDVNCQDIPTTTIDGPLPTGPISLDGSKSDKGLNARTFFDGDMTPNPAYIDILSMNPDTTWDDQRILTTGHWVGAPLDDGWSAAGVNGIYGCTAVLIVSNLGVYTSHIWEVPGFIDEVDFRPTSDDFFETNVFQVLRNGALDATDITSATGISTLIGTDGAPGPLHSQFEPQVFVVTPFNTNQSPENPSMYRYEARAKQLSDQVTDMIPGALARGVYGYWPLNGHVSTGGGYRGRTIVEFDMLDGLIASEEDPNKHQAIGRWRFWVEDNLWATHSFNVYNDFFDYAGAEAGIPSNGNQKRDEDDAVHKCLIRGDVTATTSDVTSSTKTTAADAPSSTETTAADAPSSTETTAADAPSSTETTAADAPSSTETIAADAPSSTETIAADATSTEKAATTSDATSTEKADTTSDATLLPTSTLSTLITTTRAVTSDASTTSEEARTYYPCVIYGGPRVSKPYCQCSTTVSGKQYVATASLIDNSCADYTSYPSPVVPITAAPVTQAPIQTPLTTTKQGTVLVYSAYTFQYFRVNTIHITATVGYGEPSTVSTPLPSQTAVDNDGSGQCGTSDSLSKHGFGDACDRAINSFDADTVYTGFTSRYSQLRKGILMAASMGTASCLAKFECDDYGIGMKGSDIIAAREKAKKDDGIWICGHIRLSNSCSVVMDYCTNCHNKG
ncbi:hypothetical protein FPOA_11741 [Fusarium poae]|uniref:Uncharacterized protein n=1 Tax=Fusarium poae TaxID=36050 RepID=A0A1B8AHR4_FUSPO|nr:hypothetical protein FPOA_11741 [Fusarium poae]